MQRSGESKERKGDFQQYDLPVDHKVRVLNRISAERTQSGSLQHDRLVVHAMNFLDYRCQNLTVSDYNVTF